MAKWEWVAENLLEVRVTLAEFRDIKVTRRLMTSELELAAGDLVVIREHVGTVDTGAEMLCRVRRIEGVVATLELMRTMELYAKGWRDAAKEIDRRIVAQYAPAV